MAVFQLIGRMSDFLQHRRTAFFEAYLELSLDASTIHVSFNISIASAMVAYPAKWIPLHPARCF